jgi:hypothetical protein
VSDGAHLKHRGLIELMPLLNVLSWNDEQVTQRRLITVEEDNDAVTLV